MPQNCEAAAKERTSSAGKRPHLSGTAPTALACKDPDAMCARARTLQYQ